MTRKLLSLLLVTVVLSLLSGCVNYIDSEEYKKESELIITTFDTSYYDFNGPKMPGTKIAMLDTVILSANDSLKVDTIRTSTRLTIINETVKQMTSRGFTIDTFDLVITKVPADTQIVRKDGALWEDVKGEYYATLQYIVGVEEYTYYSYWGGYYGYYWWYSPGYVTTSSYRTADIYVLMGNPDPRASEGRNLWELRVNDLIRNEGENTVNSKVRQGIIDGFGQSQYLRAN